MLQFLRWQFTDDGQFIHSLFGIMDFDDHLHRTGATEDPHRPDWCKCPKCRPDLYKGNGIEI